MFRHAKKLALRGSLPVGTLPVGTLPLGALPLGALCDAIDVPIVCDFVAP